MILKLIIRRGQSVIYIVFICIACAENNYYRVISAGQLSFNCRTYYGRSGRMQGMIYDLTCLRPLGVWCTK